MSDHLTQTAAWNRARALKLHEHFRAAALAVQGGAKVGQELRRIVALLDGLPISFFGGEMLMEVSWSTINREWAYWHAGGRRGQERPEHVRQPEALLCAYKAGCGGHRKMPRELIAEFHRRLTLASGGRDKHGKAPISSVVEGIKRDFAARKYLPGIDYNEWPEGAELLWSYSTFCRRKPGRGLRALGNRGASAHKGASAYVSLNYARLRKGELYTLDDVRLDIVCIDEATGNAVGCLLYVFMEVGSRLIVSYILKPAGLKEDIRQAIKQEDVDELLAHSLQVPGFGIGVGYTTHVLFEKGSVACSDAAEQVLQGVTDGRLKIHRTGMVGGVRWLGSARDKAKGNAAGKAVIESFNRWLHHALLHLPGQRGNHRDNQPQNLGDMGKGSFFARPAKDEKQSRRQDGGTLIDQAEKLAQFDISTGRRLALKLPMLRLMELHQAVAEAIRRHNTEPGHDYRGHGRFFQEELVPGVWTDADFNAGGASHSEGVAGLQGGEMGEPQDEADAWLEDATDHRQQGATTTSPAAAAGAKNEVQTPACSPRSASTGRTYTLKPSAAPEQSAAQRTAIYWRLWNELEKAKPGLDRFALTRRAIGRVCKPGEMTAEEFAQVLRVFSAIARDAQAHNS